MRTKIGVLEMNGRVLKLPENGHLECLKYAHENGCPWDWIDLFYAAQSGHLECLKYAHENGCPGSSEYAHHLSNDAQTHE